MESDSATIFAVCAFDRWPPPAIAELLRYRCGPTLLSVCALLDGGLRVVAERAGTHFYSQDYQKVSFAGPPHALIALTWDGKMSAIQLNGKELSAATEEAQTSLELGTKYPASLEPISLPSLVAPQDATREEALFLRTLGDLAARASSSDWYELLRAAALIRQLLLEGLIHRANRPHRVGLRFTTNDCSSRPPIKFDAHWVNLNPEPLPTAQILELKLDEFLAAPCLKYRDRDASVRDVILACANAKGGVHLGDSRTHEQSTIVDFDEVVRMIGLEPSLAALRGLCAIVVRALSPLAHAIQRPKGGSPTNQQFDRR